MVTCSLSIYLQIFSLLRITILLLCTNCRNPATTQILYHPLRASFMPQQSYVLQLYVLQVPRIAYTFTLNNHTIICSFENYPLDLPRYLEFLMSSFTLKFHDFPSVFSLSPEKYSFRVSCTPGLVEMNKKRRSLLHLLF